MVDSVCIAGPIASLIIEKYLRQKITRVDLEKRVLATSLQSRYAKLGDCPRQ
jgi:penicillin-binding protein 2